MRISVEGVQVELQTLVVSLKTNVMAVEHVPSAPTKSGATMPEHRRIALQTATGMFNAECMDPMVLIEGGERYELILQISNDAYGQAKQPRLRVLASRPFVSSPVAPK